MIQLFYQPERKYGCVQDKMSLFIDGSTLSSLFYSHSNSGGNQEGLLLGQVVNHVKDHISDSQINTSLVQTCTYISSHIPWPGEDRVYSRGGVPIMEKLAALLGGHTKEEVVGWYSFRRNSSLRMSMKERTLHKHLDVRFSPHKPDRFLFFMCGHSVSTQASTHSIDHFLITVPRGAGAVKKVAMTVTNLGDTLPTQYKTLASASGPRSQAVRNILQQFRSQFVSSSEEVEEVRRIDDLSNSLNSSLMKLCKQVAASEHTTGELEQEVARLREELAGREEQHGREERAGIGGPAHPHLYPRLSDPSLGSSCVDLMSSDPPDLGHVQGSNNSSFPPIIPSTLDETQPPSPPSANVRSGAVLQSVVDTIDDTDEEEGASAQAKPSASDLSGAAGPAGGKLAAISTRTPQPDHDQLSLSMDQTQGASAAASGAAAKLKDHFSFVDNILTSEAGGGSALKSTTVTVPTGATLTYSPRTTRSKAKNGAPEARKTSLQEKSQPGGARMQTNSKGESVLSSNPSERFSKTGLPNRTEQADGRLLNTTAKNVSARSRERANSSSPNPGRSAANSNPRCRLDPADVDLEGRQRSSSDVAGGNRSLRHNMDCNRAERGPQENGSSGMKDTEQQLFRSSSPIY